MCVRFKSTCSARISLHSRFIVVVPPRTSTLYRITFCNCILHLHWHCRTSSLKIPKFIFHFKEAALVISEMFSVCTWWLGIGNRRWLWTYKPWIYSLISIIFNYYLIQVIQVLRINFLNLDFKLGMQIQIRFHYLCRYFMCILWRYMKMVSVLILSVNNRENYSNLRLLIAVWKY